MEPKVQTEQGGPLPEVEWVWCCPEWRSGEAWAESCLMSYSPQPAYPAQHRPLCGSTQSQRTDQTTSRHAQPQRAASRRGSKPTGRPCETRHGGRREAPWPDALVVAYLLRQLCQQLCGQLLGEGRPRPGGRAVAPVLMLAQQFGEGHKLDDVARSRHPVVDQPPLVPVQSLHHHSQQH
jgi:hypothetical protein